MLKQGMLKTGMSGKCLLKEGMVLAATLAFVVVAPPAFAGKQGKVGPGMNEAGEVIDSGAVKAGWGEEVQGINDYEGEITGKPAPDSRFTQLRIGMGMKQARDLVGEPNDEGAYVTGKAFIPFYFGGDKFRYELAYKGQGRLIFAGKESGTGGNLIWVIHNANDSGYRE